MPRHLFSLVFALIFAASANAHPIELRLLTQLFTENFATGYERNACGKNIMNFVKKAARQGLALKGTVIEITNRGGTELDAVWGLQGRDEPLERWFFHVVLENEGYIYDFDFGPEPRVLPVAEYFQAMFLDYERIPSRDRPIFFGNPREDYLIRQSPVRDYLAYLETGIGRSIDDYPPVSLVNYLKESQQP